MRIVAIGSKPFITGFRLSGIKGIEVDSPQSLLREVESLLNRGDIGLIILDEGISKHVREQIDKIRAEHATPLIYELTSIGGKIEKIDYRNTLRRILGV
ncbi:MAG: V-type ATP synthase subunit F [Nitrososphaerota archaeon]|nr:V-type ATP synthase subunit F [Candidatus Geocrenenecus dongiae]